MLTNSSISRNNGLPLSHWIRQVSSRFRLPVNAIMVTAIFSSTLPIILLRNSVALDTMMSLAATTLMSTYVLSIGCIAFRRYRKQPLPRAQWPLGKTGLSVNCVALVYSTWSAFWLLWPVYCHVSAATFNWTIVLVVTWMMVALLFYKIGAKRTYEGPVAKVQDWIKGW